MKRFTDAFFETLSWHRTRQSKKQRFRDDTQNVIVVFALWIYPVNPVNVIGQNLWPWLITNVSTNSVRISDTRYTEEVVLSVLAFLTARLLNTLITKEIWKLFLRGQGRLINFERRRVTWTRSRKMQRRWGSRATDVTPLNTLASPPLISSYFHS